MGKRGEGEEGTEEEGVVEEAGFEEEGMELSEVGDGGAAFEEIGEMASAV